MTLTSPTRPRLSRTQVLVLVGVLAVALNLRSGVTVVGPLVPTIREATGQDNTALGLLGTLPVLAFGVCSPLVPALGRRIGLGPSLAAAMGLLAAALLLRSAGGFGLLLLGTALMGAAITIGNVLLPALVKRVFPARAGLVTSLYGGVLVAGAGIAAAVAVPVARATSWERSLAVWAIPAALAGMAVLGSLLADRRGVATPGQTPTAPAPRAEATAAQPPGEPAAVRQVGRSQATGLLRDPVAWQVTAYMGAQSALFYIVFNWWTDIVLLKGVTEAQAGVQLTVMSLTGLIGITVFPVFTDRMTSQRGLCALTAVLMAVSTAMLLAPAAALTMPAALIFGIGSGGALGLSLALIGLRTSDEQQASALSGMAQTWGYLISAAGPLGVGALSEATGGWTVPVVLLVVLSAATGVAGILAGRDVRVAV